MKKDEDEAALKMLKHGAAKAAEAGAEDAKTEDAKTEL